MMHGTMGMRLDYRVRNRRGTESNDGRLIYLLIRVQRLSVDVFGVAPQ